MRNIPAALLGAVVLLAAGRANALPQYSIEFSYTAGATTGIVNLIAEKVAPNAYLAMYLCTAQI